MLTKSEAHLAILALEQLHEASKIPFRQLRKMSDGQISALIQSIDNDDAPITPDDVVRYVDEAEKATEMRFTTLYIALNKHLNDESVK